MRSTCRANCVVANEARKGILDAGAENTQQLLVIAGPEWKDVGPAGRSKGLLSQNAYSLQACVAVIGYLQQLQHKQLLQYIVENTALQYSFCSAAIQEVPFRTVCGMLGTPGM